ncbi:MAG: PH domain-containing protein [Burkholderiales bacterium]
MEPKESVFFKPLIETDETLHWTGRPALLPATAPLIPLLALAIAWGVTAALKPPIPANLSVYEYALVVLVLSPCWVILLWFAYAVVLTKNTRYAYTERALLIRSGLWRPKITRIAYGSVLELKLSVGLLEKPFGLGSVLAYSGRQAGRAGKYYDKFVGIPRVHEVFERIQSLMAAAGSV